MCLTPEAIQERKWGLFPVMRQVIQDERIPDYYYGFTSISDNMLDQMMRTTEIAILVKEFKQNIKAQAQPLGRDEMYEDLCRLEGTLKQMHAFFGDAIDEISQLKKIL